MDFSVIVTTYNQTERELLFTLNSVIGQEGCDFEIVVADDGSKCDPSPLVREYMKSRGFERYAIARSQENVQTVRNVIHGLEFASGKYAKVVAAGDALYDEHVLRDTLDFCERRACQMGFGRISSFTRTSEGAKVREFKAPKSKRFYTGDCDNATLLKHQLEQGDWVPGGAQFFETSLFKELLTALSEVYGVRYVEDFCFTLALCNELPHPQYFDRSLLWYEWGVGISTTATPAQVKRMYADNQALYDCMGVGRPYGCAYQKARTLFRAKHVIANIPPLYRLFHKAASWSYNKADSSEGSGPNDFFFRCLP